MISAIAKLGKTRKDTGKRKEKMRVFIQEVLIFTCYFHDARHVATDSASPLFRVYGNLEGSNLNTFIDWSGVMCNICVNEAQCRLFTVHYWELSGAAVGCSNLLTAERGHAQCMGPTLAQSVIPCGRSRGEGSCALCWSRQKIFCIALSAVCLGHQQTTFTRLSFSRVPKDWLGRRLVIDVDGFGGMTDASTLVPSLHPASWRLP